MGKLTLIYRPTGETIQLNGRELIKFGGIGYIRDKDGYIRYGVKICE